MQLYTIEYSLDFERCKQDLIVCLQSVGNCDRTLVGTSVRAEKAFFNLLINKKLRKCHYL